jgi:hypothetical protein
MGEHMFQKKRGTSIGNVTSYSLTRTVTDRCTAPCVLVLCLNNCCCYAVCKGPAGNSMTPQQAAIASKHFVLDPDLSREVKVHRNAVAGRNAEVPKLHLPWKV